MIFLFEILKKFASRMTGKKIIEGGLWLPRQKLDSDCSGWHQKSDPSSTTAVQRLMARNIIKTGSKMRRYGVTIVSVVRNGILGRFYPPMAMKLRAAKIRLKTEGAR